MATKAKPQTFEQYIAAKSASLGLDPAAVLSIASVEGGLSGGSPGDHGTSFGPFQLHVGGRLPSNVKNPQTWAWSKQGIDYALAGIAGVAKGQQGHQAIVSIASGFEQPQDVPHEIAAADANYLKYYHYDNPKGLPVLGVPATGLGGVGVGVAEGGAVAGEGAVGGGIGAGGSALLKRFLGATPKKGLGAALLVAFGLDRGPEALRHFLLRVIEVIAGAFMFWLGIRMVGFAGLDATAGTRRQVVRAYG